jgi:hypothetical protein
MPPVGLDLSGKPAAYCVDSVLYATGRRLCRNPADGRVKIQKASTARSKLFQQATFFTRMFQTGGNEYSIVPTDGAIFDDAAGDTPPTFDPDTVDIPAAIPSAFTLYAVLDGDINRRFEVATTTLYPDLPLAGDDKSVKGWRANWSFQTDAVLETYLWSLAKAWIQWQLTVANYCFAGTIPWEPEASCDHVEWHLSGSHAFTAVRRPPWDDGINDLISLPEGGAGGGMGTVPGGECTCTPLPMGWTDLGKDCEIDLIERSCASDNSQIKRTYRICLQSDGFRVSVSPWVADTDPAPPPP